MILCRAVVWLSAETLSSASTAVASSALGTGLDISNVGEKTTTTTTRYLVPIYQCPILFGLQVQYIGSVKKCLFLIIAQYYSHVMHCFLLRNRCG